MDFNDGALVFAVGLVLALTLVTGPLGPLSVPDAGPDVLATGGATVSVESVPDGATLTPGTYTDVHYLEIPEVVLHVTDVRGSPLVSTSLSIQQLGYSRSSAFVLDEGMEGRRAFTIERSTVESSRVENETYHGRLRVVLRADSGSQTLVDRNVTVEVTG